MRKKIASLAVLCAIALCCFSFGTTSAREFRTPHRFLPNSLDRGLIEVSNPIDGRTWAVWSYRNGAEYDIALSYATGSGSWSEPVFLGRDDGLDQIEPALVADAGGTLYVAYAELETNRVMLSFLPANGERWAQPVILAASAVGRTPALRLVGDRVIVAYRAPEGIRIVDFPTLTTGTNHSIFDGPDPAATGTATGPKEGDPDDDDDDGSQPELPPDTDSSLRTDTQVGSN
jgi:hypothetical protein